MKRLMLVLVVAGGALVACDTGEPSAPGGFRLRGTVLSRDEASPLPGALVVAELGDIYVKNPDPTQFAPAYVIGTITDSQGNFDVDIPDDVAVVGIHSFSDGYRYGSLKFNVRDGNAIVTTRRHFLAVPGDAGVATVTAENEVEPTANDFLVSSAGSAPATALTVAPGAMLDFSVIAKAAAYPDPNVHDPLSDEILIVQPELSWSGAMTPPPEGCATTGCVQGKAFPDGKWTRSIAAPATPGVYKYYNVGTSEKCVTSRRLTVTVTVQ